MKQLIVIVTNDRNEDWVKNLLSSILTPYKILVYTNDYENSEFELGALRHAYENTDADEILLLQDTVEIKDNKLFDVVFFDYVGKSVFINPQGQSYLNKYRREVLDKMVIPVVSTKMESIDQEGAFHRLYESYDNNIIRLCPDLVDREVFVKKFGARKMMLECEYLKKYKGVWDKNMVKDKNG